MDLLQYSAPTMPALDRNVKVTFGKCETSVTLKNLFRHKSRRSGGTLYFTQRPIFSTKSQNDLTYHFAKKHSAPNLMLLSSVNFVIKSFQVFTLYVKIETLNTECRSDQEQGMCMWNT